MNKKCNFTISPTLSKKEISSVCCHELPGNYRGKRCFASKFCFICSSQHSDLTLTKQPRTGLCKSATFLGDWVKITDEVTQAGKWVYSTSYANISSHRMQFTPLTCINNITCSILAHINFAALE